MKKKKVCLKSSWTSDENITRRLLTQFKTDDSDVDKIEFSTYDDAELVFFFGYITHQIDDTKKYFVFPQEPSWSGNHPRHFPINENITLYGFDRNLYHFNGCFIESPSIMFYGGRGPESEGWDDWTYEKIKCDRPKEKKISSCVSNLGMNMKEFPEGCLYNQRVSLIQTLIQKTDFLDFFSWEPNGKNVKGWLSKKIDGLVDYKFSLCIENSSERNYISEKFYDCVLNDTIPIYYGCSNIEEFLPEEGYILIDDLNDIDGIISKLNYINKNCDEIYNRLLPNLRKIKKRYFEEFNPLKIINNICS